MLWCCASLSCQRPELDDNHLEEQEHEVVVEKLAIKSIPLPPRQRLSHSPERSNLKCQISKHSLTASQRFETLGIQQLQTLSNNKSYPLSSFTKLERIQETAATEYVPSQQGIDVRDCTMLFTSVFPQDQMCEDISNPYPHKKIITSDSDTLIYKPLSDTSSESNSHHSESIPDRTSDLIYKEPKFDNESVSEKLSLTQMTSTNNMGSNGATSIFFPSSERLIHVEELDYHASSVEDQNLTENTKEVCETTSEMLNKNSQSQSITVRTHSAHCLLTIHENQNDGTSDSEKTVKCSNSEEQEDQNLIDIQVPFSPSRRNIPLSASSIDVRETLGSSVAVKQESHSKDTKSCVTTLSAPSLISVTHQTVPEQTFQQSTASDIELNEDKTINSDLSHSTEQLEPENEEIIMPHPVNDAVSIKSKENDEYSDKHTKSTEELEADIEKETEQTTISLNAEDLTLTESNKGEKYSNENTESIVTSLLPVNDQHPTYTHSTSLKSPPTTKRHLRSQILEPMPTFIAFNKRESKLKKKIFTPDHLSLFLATLIKNGWTIPESKFVHDTSRKTARLRTVSGKSTSLQTKHALKNELKAFRQAQQNISNFSSSCKYKRKFENLQYCPHISTYNNGSSKAEKYKAKWKYVKNTVGDSCPKELTTLAYEVNRNTHSEDNKCSETTICTSSCQRTDSLSTHEYENTPYSYVNSSSISSSETHYHKSIANVLQIPENPSKCTQKLELSKQALQYWPKHRKCATSKVSENMLDYHSLSSTSDFANPAIYKQNILEAAKNYEIQKRSYNNHKKLFNHKKVRKTNKKTIYVCPCISNSPDTLPTQCDKIPIKQQQFISCKSTIQPENLEDITTVKKMTVYKETKKISYSDTKQCDNDELSSCIPKADADISDVLSLSSSSSYNDHSYHGRSYPPISKPSQSSLMTIEETQEPTICWTIIIKHVDPDELLE